MYKKYKQKIIQIKNDFHFVSTFAQNKNAKVFPEIMTLVPEKGAITHNKNWSIEVSKRVLFISKKFTGQQFTNSFICNYL